MLVRACTRNKLEKNPNFTFAVISLIWSCFGATAWPRSLEADSQVRHQQLYCREELVARRWPAWRRARPGWDTAPVLLPGRSEEILIIFITATVLKQNPSIHISLCARGVKETQCAEIRLEFSILSLSLQWQPSYKSPIVAYIHRKTQENDQINDNLSLFQVFFSAQ